MNLLVTIDSDEHAKSLMEKIKLLEHVTQVQVEYPITDDILQMVEERYNDYKKNPTDVIPWEELKANIQKKHGY